MFQALRLSQAVFALAYLTSIVSAKCYAPDGHEITRPEAGPCSDDPNDPLSNICCNVNRKYAPGTFKDAAQVRDTCLPNGMCQNWSLDSEGNDFYQWGRDYCTESDWNSGKCLNVCTQTAGDVRTPV